MIVEDDPDTREILDMVLRRRFGDVAVTTARNGREALQLFERERVDLVITDLNMPEVGGEEMMREIRLKKPDVPIIVLTADTGKAADEGAWNLVFLLKPVEYQLLFSAIESSLAGRG